MLMTLAEMADALGVSLPTGFDGAREYVSVSSDSRKVEAGALFVCIPGERFDGHEFAAQAVAAGAKALLSSRKLAPEIEAQVPVLHVPDVLRGLASLARVWREKAGAKLIAISGSAGKTTLKEMLAAILGRLAPTAKNFKNLNNRIGLPMSMLAARAEDRFWVMELGISLPGEMDELGRAAGPDLAVIHNIGPAHLEGLGDLSGVAKEKTKLLKHLRPGGTALVSQDYPLLWQQAKRIYPQVKGLSLQGLAAPFCAQCRSVPGVSGLELDLDLQGLRFGVKLPFCGRHLAENALAAAAAAKLCGAAVEDIQEGLSTATPPEQRFCAFSCNGLTLIDDTYNANPLSMQRSIEAACELCAGKPLVLVLGEMRELGAQSAARHEELGRFIAQLKPAAVFFRGVPAKELENGLSSENFQGLYACPAGAEEFRKAFAGLGLAEATVLFKGSRSLKMEEYLIALKQYLEGGQ